MVWRKYDGKSLNDQLKLLSDWLAKYKQTWLKPQDANGGYAQMYNWPQLYIHQNSSVDHKKRRDIPPVSAMNCGLTSMTIDFLHDIFDCL